MRHFQFICKVIILFKNFLVFMYIFIDIRFGCGVGSIVVFEKMRQTRYPRHKALADKQCD